MKKSILVTGILFLFAILLFLGGLGIEVELVQYFGLAVGMVFLFATFIIEGKLKSPPGLSVYSVFILLFAVSILWSVDRVKTLEVLSLFLSGGIFWMVFYNLNLEESFLSVEKILLGLGVIFGALFVYYNFFVNAEVRWRSLFLPYSSGPNHNNIGDFWAVVFLVVSYALLKNYEKVIYWILLAVGVYFLVASQSRSALVALFVGFTYLTKDKLEKKKYRHLVGPLVVIVVGLFLYLGLGKTTIFTRPYYFQAIAGLFRNPFGVGIGNFFEISKDEAYHLLGFSGQSVVVHNIVLEVLAGMGVFGLTFGYWFFEKISEVWNKRGKTSLLYGACFLALASNFFLHSSYFNPTMFWFWFVFLGLFQKNLSRS